MRKRLLKASRLLEEGRKGDCQALDEAVERFDQLRRAISLGHDWHAALVVNYCQALIVRYQARGDDADLAEAVRLLREEKAALRPGQPHRAEVLTTLGYALHRDAERTGSARTMDEAIRARRAGLAATSRRSPDYDQRLSDLAGALASKGALTRDPSALKEAIQIHTAVSRRTPPDHPHYAIRLSYLGVAYAHQYENTGDESALDASIEADRRAVDAAKADDPDLCMLLSNLGITLGHAFDLRGSTDDLDESITFHSRAVQAAPPGNFDRPRCLISQATALQREFEATGNLGALTEAISAFRQAIAAAPPAHPQYARALCGLGGTLLLRYLRIGDTAGLHESQEWLDKGVRATPEDHPNRPDRLSQLSCVLYTRFKASSGMYPQITAPLREALNLAPSGHVRRAYYLSNLGGFLNDEYELTADRATLDEAVQLNAEAVAQTPTNHKERGKRLANWGVSLTNRARMSSDPGDAAEAVAVCEEALAAMSPDDPDRTQSLLALANALLLHNEFTQGSDGHTKVLEVCRQAVEQVTAPTLTRIQAAHTLGHQAARAGDTATGLTGLAAAVSLVDEAAWRGLDREALVQILQRTAQLPEDAAALALQTGQPRRAVELLEQGRGVLLAQTLDDHTSYDQVHEHAPQLAERLAGVLQALVAVPQTAVALEGDRIYPAAEQPSPMDKRTVLAAERDDLLQQIRHIPGLEDFLRPGRFDSLKDAGEHGPVVIVNVSTYRCDALVITHEDLIPVSLPDLTLERANGWNEALQRAVRQAQATPTGNSSAGKKIMAILAEIGDTITAPVLNTLEADPNTAPRIWWCPTGPVASLPLHAAGHHDSDPADTVLNRATSSYTPTLRALQHMRQRSPQPRPPRPGPLIVAMPDTPGHPRLNGAQAELDYLTCRFPQHTTLSGPAATLDAVTTAMPRHAWAHFSCHGQRDATTRSGDRLLLHDQALTASHIANMNVGDADLAFLSACDTYTTGDLVPDECLTIGAALQLAGYQHVIATQWPVYDNSTADLAADIYDTVAADQTLNATSSGSALRAAMLRARSRNPNDPTRWVPYVHLGPQ